MRDNQIKIPEKWNNKDLIKTILGLIIIEIEGLQYQQVNNAGEIGRKEAEYKAKVQQEEKEGGNLGMGIPLLSENNYYKNLIKEQENIKQWIEYYEACRKYVELYLIDNTAEPSRGE